MEHPYSDHDRSTATHTVRRNYHIAVRPPQAIAAPCTASIEIDIALLMDLLMYGIAAALIAPGLAGSDVPSCRRDAPVVPDPGRKQRLGYHVHGYAQGTGYCWLFRRFARLCQYSERTPQLSPLNKTPAVAPITD
jgi:hypothetical protein